MAAGVYKIYFKNDNKCKTYIGISKNLTRRKHDHKAALIEDCHKNPFLQNAFKKYGLDNFTFEILEICNVSELISKEEQYIKKFNSFNNKFGYNLTNGGEHKILSESTKKKLSKVKSGRKLSDKTKIKLVVHNLLKKRPELKVEVIDSQIYVNGKLYKKSTRGKFRTPEDDEKFVKRKEAKSKWQSDFMRKMATGRVKSDDEKEKIRKANFGRKSSEETKRKIGSYHIGKNITDEHREAIKNKLGHAILLIHESGKEIVFKSKKECAKYLFISDQTIKRYLDLNKKIKGYQIKICKYAS